MKIKGIKHKRLEFDMNNINVGTWCDKDHLMFIITMELVRKYVDDEDAFNVINWNWHPDYKAVKEEIQKIYKFWKCYDGWVNRLEDKYLGNEWRGTGSSKKCEDKPGFYEWVYDNPLELKSPWNIYEDKIKQVEDQMMIRAINVRKHMWT